MHYHLACGLPRMRGREAAALINGLKILVAANGICYKIFENAKKILVFELYIVLF